MLEFAHVINAVLIGVKGLVQSQLADAKEDGRLAGSRLRN